jgi:hypothetical protein
MELVSRIQPASDLLIGADPPALDAAARAAPITITDKSGQIRTVEARKSIDTG